MREIYAYKGLDEEVMKSSSGAAFIGFCKVFFNKCKNEKGYVYGATFDENLDVIHKGVSTLKECEAFQGSKYVKSNCKRVYLDIETKIKEGAAVLFSGTPCQVSSLKKYLDIRKVDRKKLFLVDIICHGTPKPIIWRDYKKWLEAKNGSLLRKYCFRFKREGWKAYPALACFENGKSLKNTSDTSVFSRLFLKRYSISKGCFSCKYSNMNREGDITIGDFWGIENIRSSFPSKKGVTLVLVNTESGKHLINEMDSESNEVVIEKINCSNFINYQHNLQRPTEEPNGYDSFWSDYKTASFDDIVKKYLGYGLKYKIIFSIKKYIRKTPLINTYRKLKNR
ncbi:MAG: hypothetical protein GX270_00860 [Clostridiaceae bacterium]|nr:hypothetical protein [Clostridiaceae bacterium]